MRYRLSAGDIIIRKPKLMEKIHIYFHTGRWPSALISIVEKLTKKASKSANIIDIVVYDEGKIYLNSSFYMLKEGDILLQKRSDWSRYYVKKIINKLKEMSKMSNKIKYKLEFLSSHSVIRNCIDFGPILYILASELEITIQEYLTENSMHKLR